MSSLSKSVSNSSSEDDKELRRGPWTAQEDSLLIQYISNHGEGRWNLLAKGAGLRRTGKSCRLRWLNYLKPDVKRGNLTPEEQLLILELHSKWGNRWSKIAHHLPGRTDNEIKNYWRTRIQKQARHLKIDTNSAEFHNIVRRFWMPRLLQKPKETSCSAISLQNQTVPLLPDSAVESSLIGRVPSQFPLQGTCVNEKEVSFDHHDQNSDSDYKNGSCMSSSESADIPKIPQFLGSTTINSSQFHASSNSDYLDFAYDGYYGSNNVYGMEISNLATTEAAGDMQMQFPLSSGCQMADNSWLNNDFACSMWNTDELWQFRNLQN